MKQKISLRTGLLLVIFVCWLVPILIIVTMAGVLIGSSYEQSARQEIDAAAQYAVRQIQSELETAINDSKSVSYDGVIRTAYRAYQESGNHVVLYRNVSDYLAQNFSRAELYKAVFLCFWDENVKADSYVYGSGKNGAGILQTCRDAAPNILEIMAGEDTQIRFLTLGEELFMARNLLDSHFEPYASLVMLMEPEALFKPLSAIGSAEEIQLSLDDARFLYDDQSGRFLSGENLTGASALSYSTEVDGHRLALLVAPTEYHIWDDNPWLFWVVAAVALMVLPLLLVMILLIRHHVSKPVDTLVQANLKVQAGQRGFAIADNAPNREFGTLYDHFNDMSAELKKQFERSYLEQQATQRAQIKALQSQINPHFLNNTLEVINWEARLAGNERVGTMIEALSTMLDAALDRDGRTQISLREELGYVDAYLYIIQQRLGESFHVYKEVDEALLDQLVPRLILQPLVENAVEHDITARRGGSLWVRTGMQDGTIFLEVEHDGSMSEEDRKKIDLLLSGAEDAGGGSLGISNVNRRLKLLYGEQGKLTVSETETGTILARIRFPAAELKGGDLNA